MEAEVTAAAPRDTLRTVTLISQLLTSLIFISLIPIAAGNMLAAAMAAGNAPNEALANLGIGVLMLSIGYIPFAIVTVVASWVLFFIKLYRIAIGVSLLPLLVIGTILIMMIMIFTSGA